MPTKNAINVCCACRRGPRQSLNLETVGAGSKPAVAPRLKCSMALRRCAAVRRSCANNASVWATSASDTRPSAFATKPNNVKVVSKNCARIMCTASGPDSCSARHSPLSKACPKTRPNKSPAGPKAISPMRPAINLPVTLVIISNPPRPAKAWPPNRSDRPAPSADSGIFCTATGTVIHCRQPASLHHG